VQTDCDSKGLVITIRVNVIISKRIRRYSWSGTVRVFLSKESTRSVMLGAIDAVRNGLD
jgi:hypothetical protein